MTIEIILLIFGGVWAALQILDRLWRPEKALQSPACAADHRGITEHMRVVQERFLRYDDVTSSQLGAIRNLTQSVQTLQHSIEIQQLRMLEEFKAAAAERTEMRRGLDKLMEIEEHRVMEAKKNG